MLKKVDYTNCYALEKFNIYDLIKLSGQAKTENIELRIKAEYSNFYQGTMLEVQRNWDRVEDKIIHDRKERAKLK